MKRATILDQISPTTWQQYSKVLQKSGKPITPQQLDELIYLRAYHDFRFFVEYFFPHHCKQAFSRMHLDFCEAEGDPTRRGRRNVVAAPRGHAKTTFKMLMKTLHAIVYGYERFILIVAFTKDEAEEKTMGVLGELCHNKRLRRVYGDLAPRRGKKMTVTRWGKKDFKTANGIRVLGKSRGEQLRGIKDDENRPSLIICDDIESPEGVLTPEQRKKTYDWFMKDLLKCGQIDDSSNVTVIGTCLHPESLLMTLLQTPGWNAQRYQAVESFPEHEAPWEEYRALYTNLSDPYRVEQAHAYFLTNKAVMLAGVKVLWPENDNYEKLMRMRIDEGEASFRSEKQNEPYDPERQIFNMAEAKQFSYVIEDNQIVGLRWEDGSNKYVPYHSLEVVIYHDPAMADKKESDYAALVVCAKDLDGYLYCLDAWIERVPPDKQIREAFRLYASWACDRLYLETNNFQKLLRNVYYDHKDKHGLDMDIRCVTPHENKHKRISTMEPHITNGQLLFADTLSRRFIDQMTMFPTSYDDGPDALHGAWSRLTQRGGTVTCIHPGHVPV